MKTIPQKRFEARERRHRRVRKKIRGTAERPRLSVYRSLKNITAQLHDDIQGRCLITVSSMSPEVKAKVEGAGGKAGVSAVVGKVLAERAASMGLERVVFDRSGYRYHGRVRSLAEGAREGGLKF